MRSSSGRRARHDGDQGRREDRHDRRVRTDDELTRGAKERIGDQRRDAGVNAGLGRQARDRRIGDGAGKADRGNREPGGDIVSNPARLIAGKARKHGKVQTHRAASLVAGIDRTVSLRPERLGQSGQTPTWTDPALGNSPHRRIG